MMQFLLDIGKVIFPDQEDYKVWTKLLGNCAYILGALIGIPANFIVLQRIISTKELRISVSYLFIFNLALADLFFLSGTPLMVSNSIQNTWKFGTFMCKAFLASNGANQFASSLFMALLSLDRYTAICCKGKIKDYKTQCSAIFLCTISWLIIFLAIFPLYYFGTIVHYFDNNPNNFNSTTQTSTKVCMLVWSGSDKGDALFGDNLDTIENLEFSRKIFTAYTFALGYIIPLMAIWYFYGNIIYAVWRQGTSSLIANRNLRKRTMKITWLGVSIALIYSFCWFPFWYVQWSIEEMSEWTLRHDLLMPISYMAYVLCYFNSVINPFAFINYSNRIKQQIISGNAVRRFEKSLLQPLALQKFPVMSPNESKMTTEGQTAMTESNEVGSSGSSNESYEKKTKVEGTPDSTMPPNYHNFIIYEIQRNIHSYTTSQLLELRYKLVTRHIDCLDAIRECIAIHGKESVKIGAVQNIDGLSLKQLLDNGIDGMNIPKIKYVAHCLEDSIRAVVMDDFDRSPVV